MSTLVEPAVRKTAVPTEGAAVQSHGTSWWLYAVALLILLSHVPLVLVHFGQLIRYRPHYEFFPFVLAAAIYLLYRRWPPGAAVEHTRLTRWGGVAVLAGAVLVNGVAVLFFSPLLGTVAAILAAGGILLLLTGRTAWENLLGPWCLLWLVVPPPFHWDASLIRWLQRTTGQLGSRALEAVSIEHVLAGHIFRLPGRELLVTEACSGIHSQLVLLAACFVVAVMTRRRGLHVVLLAVAAIFWSLVVNTTRVATIVAAQAAYGVDLSAGWRHEALGAALVLAGFGMLLATNNWLRDFLAPIEIPSFFEIDRTKKSEKYSVRALAQLPFWERNWNIWISGLKARSKTARPPCPAGRWGLLSGAALLVVTLLCLGGGALQGYVVAQSAPRHHSQIDNLQNVVQESWLPDRVQRWSLVGHALEERDRGSDFGQYSRVWRYAADGRELAFSVDFPFVGWHELIECYVGRGWRPVSRSVATQRSERGEAEFIVAEFRQPNGQAALLMFDLFDIHGNPVSASTRGRFGPSRQRFFQARPVVETIQTQLFTVSSLPFSEEEKRELQRAYSALREQVHQRFPLPENEG